MRRARCFRALAALLAGLAAGSVRAAQAPPPSSPQPFRPPNIILIVADDLGRADVGFMGATDIQTPHLDQLAREGAILDAFYVQPVCSPTRACLLTGRYPTGTGIYTIVRPRAKWGLPPAERTLAQALREAGYQTAICGKWHLGEFELAYRPTHRGFDLQYGNWFGAMDYFKHKYRDQPDWYRNDQPLREKGYATQLLAGEAIRLIRERKDSQPLFLYLSFNAVHEPYQVPKAYRAAYRHLRGTRRTMAAMISALDEAIGQVVAALQEQNLRERTLIVFTSDNGGAEPGRVSNNGLCRDGKGSLYEGGVRVCALACWPGRIRPGTVIREPLHAVDWYPTLIKLAGGSLTQPLPPDGLDIWPVLTAGAKLPRNSIPLAGVLPATGALRAGDWKLLVNPGATARKAKGPGLTTKGEERNTTTSEAAVWELYNLAVDPGETENLAKAQPEKLHELRAQLEAHLKNAAPPGDRNPGLQ